MKKPVSLIATLSAVTSLAVGPAPANNLRIELFSTQPSLLERQPVRVRVVLTNVGQKTIRVPASPLDQGVFLARPVGTLVWKTCMSEIESGPGGPPASRQLKAGETLAFYIENIATRSRSMVAGDFQIALRTPWAAEDQAEAWTDQTTSDPLTISIIRPRAGSIDEKALNDPSVWGRNGMALLEKYPSSIYAGRLLVHLPCGAVAHNSLTGKDLLDEFMKPREKRMMNGVVIGRSGHVTAEETAEECIPKVEEFLIANPDAPEAFIGWMKLAMGYCVLHRWQDAYDAIDRSIEKPWPDWFMSDGSSGPSRERRVLAELRDELVKRALVTPRDDARSAD